MAQKTPKSYLEALNPEQRRAVEATEGPVLVLAGAGSGKTRVLTYRIAYLIQEKKVPPWQILAMTFTKKAANEMRERVKGLIDDARDLWIGTFHSTFAKILRWEAESIGYHSNFVIYDTEDKIRLIKSIMQNIDLPYQQFNAKTVAAVISKIKNSLMDPNTYFQNLDNPLKELAALIYPEYQQQLRANVAFDFDDLITVPITIFLQYPHILRKYQDRFQYVLIDEYQDTNRAQYMLILHLTQNNQNICVVGDDDQSIYRWRGADIRNILEFENDFPDTTVFKLEQNYRSTQNILIAASSVVKKNKGRRAKKLWSDSAAGEKIEILEVEDEREEAWQVVKKISEEVSHHKRAFHDFVLLYRTNAQSRALEDALRRSGMSYIIVGGVRFYERKEIKDILAYLKLIVNPKDSISLQRIINFPLRGIGDVSYRKVERWAKERDMDVFTALHHVDDISGISSRVKKSIQEFYDIIQKYININDKIQPNELVDTLVNDVGLLAVFLEDTSLEGQGRIENIQEFLGGINEYVEETNTPTLAGFLEEVSLITDVDQWNDQANAITLMTLHCAKGLEFPVVFITGLEEGLFPVSRSLAEPEAIEEERRLFYVGLTRAKEKVYLTCARSRHFYGDGQGRFQSRFLDELNPDVIEIVSNNRMKPSIRKSRIIESDFYQTSESTFSQEIDGITPGTWILHELFGRGKIIQVDGTGEKQKITIQFENRVQKKFLTRYAKFQIL